jgi:hypothetical protein
MNKQNLLRVFFSSLGILLAGTIALFGAIFVFTLGERIVEKLASGNYSSFILLVQVLETAAIIFPTAAFAMDIIDDLVVQLWKENTNTHHIVYLLRKLESEAVKILIPMVAIYSTLKILEFAAGSSFEISASNWAEPLAYSGVILLSLLVHRVLGQEVPQ